VANFTQALRARQYLVLRVNAAEAAENRENLIASTDLLDLLGIAKTLLSRRARATGPAGSAGAKGKKAAEDILKKRAATSKTEFPCASCRKLTPAWMARSLAVNERRIAEPKPAAYVRSVVCFADALRSGTGVISTQVLQEYANVALGQLAQRQDVVLRQLAILERLVIVPQTPALVRRAVELRTLYGISFWDASIVSAAESSECREMISEDLNAGQFYGRAVVVNPFAH
jgi:predicted nucleic acid-binding protein